ncbi:hypothetical protein PQX77_012877 [Marasmius sp. AFHP31]|nr:hypothetical protein PQX77_012877 [Marasmius sp. AFHP31]
MSHNFPLPVPSPSSTCNPQRARQLALELVFALLPEHALARLVSPDPPANPAQKASLGPSVNLALKVVPPAMKVLTALDVASPPLSPTHHLPVIAKTANVDPEDSALATLVGLLPTTAHFAGSVPQASSSPLLETAIPASWDARLVLMALEFARRSYAFNGGCVAADGNGVCQGTNLIADNNKVACDTCGAKCTTCRIPNFSVASTVNELECTGCLPGSFLHQGKCVDTCPQGTFIDPKDNRTCTACDSSCGTCAGSSTFCLTCASSASLAGPDGKCVSNCPSNTFQNPTTRQCSSCHPDCATCSGTSFNQCQTCPPERPVLNNGRCLPTCGKGQFFDGSGCKACDGSCASCTAAGSDKCLSCSNAGQVLKGGSCVDAGCTGGTSVIPGLGICLSNLVQVPTTTGGETPLPSITGINNPTVTETKVRLEWWQILLMALGCAFIFLIFVMCWRRRMRKRRAAATKQFARAKNLDEGGAGWRWRMVRFGERLFGHRPSKRAYPAPPPEDIKLRDIEEGYPEPIRKNRNSVGHSTFDMDGLIGAYQYRDDDHKSSKKSHAPSVLPSLNVHHHHHHTYNNGHNKDLNRLSGSSLYSEITGMPRHTPETRQPVKTKPLLLNPNTSRFSSTSYGTSIYSKSSNNSSSSDLLRKVTTRTTDAQRYAREVRPTLGGADGSKVEVYPKTGALVDTSDDVSAMRGGYWMQPQYTGASNNNPFRK